MPISYVDEHDTEMVSARNEAASARLPPPMTQNSTTDIYARVGNLKGGETNYAPSFEYGSSAVREPVVYGQMAPDKADGSVVYGQMGADASVVYETLPE
jgi:hypothetical protein